MIGAPSIFKLTHRAAVLTKLLPIFALSCPRKAARLKWKVECAIVVYYESLKRELKTKKIYGYRCDERLKTSIKESTRLACTPLCAELEHLKIETRLTSETPVSL